MTEDEIRTLWHGLDREDMPWDRKTRLAIKFALTTMLRSGESPPIDRDELNTENGTVDIPARRVKRRRVINQPLSDLALEIIREAMGNYQVRGRRFVSASADPLPRRGHVKRADRHQGDKERQAGHADAGHLPTAWARARSRRMICGGRRRRCAVNLVCRRKVSRSARPSSEQERRTASRCQRLPTASQPCDPASG